MNGASLAIALLALQVAQVTPAPTPGDRALPARTIPVPQSVSPALQQRIAAPLQAGDGPFPTTTAGIKALIAGIDAQQRIAVDAVLHRFPATIERRTIAGVDTYLVTPSTFDPRNHARLLVHVHGGAYALFHGYAALDEAALVAHYARTRVLSIDYRMPPDHPFPAALDDTVAVWRDVVAHHDPHALALFGTSAGGGLTLAAVERFKQLGLPLPAALFAGTPWADLTKSDDSQFTNDGLDDVLTGDNLDAYARMYAGTHDLREPLISPLYGDFHGFPPTILISGTRDLLLSMTVRTHRKLRAAGVDAELHIFEAMSHAEYLVAPTIPESAEAFGEVATFFDHHLTR